MSSRPTTSTAATATPTTSACTMSPSGPSHGPAIRPRTRSSSLQSTAGRDRPRRTVALPRGPRASSTNRRIRRRSLNRCTCVLRAPGQPNPWAPPRGRHTRAAGRDGGRGSEDARAPDETISAWIDVSGEPLERKWAALAEHKTQIAADFPMVAVRPRRMARAVDEGGLHPARVPRRNGPTRRRPVRGDRLAGGHLGGGQISAKVINVRTRAARKGCLAAIDQPA